MCIPLGGGFDYELICSLIQPRLETLAQIPEKVAFLKEMPDYDVSLYYHKKMKTSAETSLPALLAAKDALSKLNDFTIEGIHDTLIPLASEMGIKNGQLLWPVRVAISGVAVTPGGANEIACLLGKEETLRRLDISIEKLKNM